MRLPTWKFRNPEEEREENARKLHEAAWPDMFANLQSAYAELTNAQFELERRTAEIAETRDLFQQVISSMSEALFLTDRSGRVIRANPAAAALLECPETTILGAPFDGRLRVGWNSGDSVEADGNGADRQIDQPRSRCPDDERNDDTGQLFSRPDA